MNFIIKHKSKIIWFILWLLISFEIFTDINKQQLITGETILCSLLMGGVILAPVRLFYWVIKGIFNDIDLKYILIEGVNDNKKELYVGETSSAINRMQQHLKNPERSNLSTINIIFDSEFNKLRSKKQDFFLTCLLSKTAWDADKHFLYNALLEWNEFDASNYADKFWQIDDEAFEEIINGFISQKYAAAEQENAVDKPYTIFQKNLEAWEAIGENDIYIYSNDYFLKEYPAEYFEIPPDEPEEDIVEAEEEVAVEESKPKSVLTVSAEKTPSAQVPSAHKVSIDTESARSRVVNSIPKRETPATARSVSHTSSEHQRTTASTAATAASNTPV